MDKSTPAAVIDAPKPAAVNGTVTQAPVSDANKPAPVSDAPKPAAVSDQPKPAAVIDTDKQPAESDKFSIKKAGKIVAYVVPAVAALFLIKYEFFTPPEVVVAKVRQEDFAGEVQGTGTINVDVLATVGAKIPGRIERVLVNEGDSVRTGQVVATLEDTDLRQELQWAQGRLEAAHMTEQAAQAMEQSARATEQSVRATAQARRATEIQAGRAWEREKHLVATGAVSQEEADQYEERDQTAASAVGAAEADIGVAQAQVGAAGAKIRATHSEIAAAEAGVRLQQFNLSQTKVFTYVGGIVTDRPKRSGDAIVPGETIISVADPTVTLVESYIDQRFASTIKAGQTAIVFLRGRDKEQIPGKVYRVRPQADPAAEELTVEISFSLPPAELRIGQWADVYVRVSETKNALTIPKTAAMTMGDGRYVLVADANNKVRRVNVEPLATSPRSQVMAVTGDLKPGEWVLTQPMGIKPGKKVRPTQSMEPADSGSKSSSPAMKM